MPTFYLNGNLVHFAAWQKHIGLYPVPSTLNRELAPYRTGKGSVRFSLEEPLPVDLIRRIVEQRVEESRKKRGKRA